MSFSFENPKSDSADTLDTFVYLATVCRVKLSEVERIKRAISKDPESKICFQRVSGSYLYITNREPRKEAKQK